MYNKKAYKYEQAGKYYTSGHIVEWDEYQFTQLDETSSAFSRFAKGCR